MPLRRPTGRSINQGRGVTTLISCAGLFALPHRPGQRVLAVTQPKGLAISVLLQTVHSPQTWNPLPVGRVMTLGGCPALHGSVHLTRLLLRTRWPVFFAAYRSLPRNWRRTRPVLCSASDRYAEAPRLASVLRVGALPSRCGIRTPLWLEPGASGRPCVWALCFTAGT